MKSPAQVSLRIRAGSRSLSLRVGGIPGIPFGDTISFSTDDGKYKMTLPNDPEFNYCQPGDIVAVHVGIVKAFVEPVAPEGMGQGLILPGKMQ